MRRSLVYDLPTRMFHWLFAGLFLTAFVIAKTIDDESPIYTWHMLAGLTLSFVVILRVAWGFFGTQHARFSGFALNPFDLFKYFKGVFSGDKRKWAGHNPASSWGAIVMMLMALGLGVTGYLMTSGPNKEDFEDIHELLSNGFIIVVIMHVTGIILHTMRFKEMIGLSMVDGKKEDVVAKDTISSAHNTVGILLIASVVAFGLNLFKNYNSETKSLNLFGTTLQLGENESGDDD
jgi:cytochrome b